MDRDSGRVSGRRARTRRELLSLCLSWLEPRVPIHLHCTDPPRLTILLLINQCVDQGDPEDEQARVRGNEALAHEPLINQRDFW